MMANDTATQMMKAAVLEADGGPEVLSVHDVGRPTPSRGEALVRLKFASINHLDIWIRKGMPSVPKPRVTGADGAGEVVAVGEGVDPTLVGMRCLLDPSITCGACSACRRGDTVLCKHFAVLGEHRAGTHAQYIVVPAVNVHRIPDHLDFAQAAALPLVFATAWRMLRTRACVEPGERVLVWGATSGVGSAALQLCTKMGVETLATTRRADALEILIALGATRAIDSSKDDVVAAAKEFSDGEGVEVVFDHLGAEVWDASLNALCRGGRYVTCGVTTGANPPAKLTRIFWKQLTILGSTMANASDFAEMLRFVAEHRITPRVDRKFPLSEIADAHRYVEGSQQVGKVVLTIA